MEGDSWIWRTYDYGNQYYQRTFASQEGIGLQPRRCQNQEFLSGLDGKDVILQNGSSEIGGGLGHWARALRWMPKKTWLFNSLGQVFQILCVLPS